MAEQVGFDGEGVAVGCFTDHVVVGVDDVHHAAVGTEVVEVEDPFGLDNIRTRQPSASWPRDVGVTVTARQYLVA